MKKLLFLSFLCILTTIINADCPDCPKVEKPTVDCASECNRGGRWVNRDVCEQCNNCEGWATDDQVIAECRDYPS